MRVAERILISGRMNEKHLVLPIEIFFAMGIP
jgi:hypothetical protein